MGRRTLDPEEIASTEEHIDAALAIIPRLSDSAIAERLDTTVDVVRRHREARGIAGVARGGQRSGWEDRLRPLLAEGLDARQIAERTGWKVGSVRTMISRFRRSAGAAEVVPDGADTPRARGTRAGPIVTDHDPTRVWVAHITGPSKCPRCATESERAGAWGVLQAGALCPDGLALAREAEDQIAAPKEACAVHTTGCPRLPCPYAP